MTGGMGIYIVFLLGVLVGVIIGNKEFRRKFFVSLRGFLAQIGRGAQDVNRRYSGNNDRRRYLQRRESEDRERGIQHIYREIHKKMTCETCGGSGRVYEELSPLQEGAIGIKPKIISCPDCDGEGKIWN